MFENGVLASLAAQWAQQSGQIFYTALYLKAITYLLGYFR